MSYDEIREEICNNYCRYTYDCVSDTELEDICDNCPLNFLN